MKSCSECWVSVTRIQNFPESPELITASLLDTTETVGEEDMKENKIIMSFSNVSYKWYENTVPTNNTMLYPNGLHGCDTSQSNATALTDINLELREESLTCVIGTVGSGKTALLLALAGELTESKGSIDRRYSTLAYAAQDPWIMNGTVKENIVMGHLLFNVNLYQDIVDACGLAHDFEQFLDGEETIVGDRGVQCSRGQRARIGLARALYRDADVVLLDDPLSAVDSKVGHRIFFSAILDLAVKRGKCVVLGM